MSLFNVTLTHAFYDNRDEFFFRIVNVPFLDDDVPSYGFYCSRLVRLALICNNVSHFHYRHHLKTDNLFHQGYRLIKLLKTFTKVYYRYTDLNIYKYNSTCRDLIKKDFSIHVFMAT